MLRRRDFLAFFGALTTLPTLQANQTKVKTGLVLDDRFLEHTISPYHPESPQRYQHIIEQVEHTSLFETLMLLTPSVNAEPYLQTIHSLQHINAIRRQSQKTHDLASLATSSLLTAVDAVCEGRVDNAMSVSRPPGHHALNTGKEEGFCYYNHIAVAARYAQQKHQIKKVLIVDWDYHHGNGTEAAFYDDSSVLFFSTHDKFAYPGTGFENRKGHGAGYGFNINVHLGCGATDADILNAFEMVLKPNVSKFKPDLILVSAGFDSRQDDLLGCHHITDDGFRKLTLMVKQLAQQYCGGRIVSVLEGGYNLAGNASAVSSHLHALQAPLRR
jgi:acetoin utilization deacetylase AcuC-like enzyme